MRTIFFTLNGRPEQLSVDDNRMLLWVLRSDLNLTGTKYGCGEGLCGACTVVLDGRAVHACRTRMQAVGGRRVTTIEGLGGATLHPLQRAFVEHEAFQCGFCAPGMIMAVYALVGANAHPSREQIVNQLDRNLCRCGAHTRVLAAVQSSIADDDGGGR